MHCLAIGPLAIAVQIDLAMCKQSACVYVCVCVQVEKLGPRIKRFNLRLYTVTIFFIISQSWQLPSTDSCGLQHVIKLFTIKSSQSVVKDPAWWIPKNL